MPYVEQAVAEPFVRASLSDCFWTSKTQEGTPLVTKLNN